MASNIWSQNANRWWNWIDWLTTISGLSASIFKFREFYFRSEKSKISDRSDVVDDDDDADNDDVDTDDHWPRTDFYANDASSPKTMSCVIFCVKQVLEKCVDWFLPIAEQTKNEAEVFFQQIESRLKRWLRIFKATKKCNRGGRDFNQPSLRCHVIWRRVILPKVIWPN